MLSNIHVTKTLTISFNKIESQNTHVQDQEKCINNLCSAHEYQHDPSITLQL